MVTSHTLDIAFPLDRLQKATDQRVIEVNPGVWSAHSAIGELGDFPRQVSREDLVKAGRRRGIVEDDRELQRLFVSTMMWGSGTANGRGPRNTDSALRSRGATAVLRDCARHLEDGQITAAYDLHRRLAGIGPSFHTKWLWVLGAALSTPRPRPLILDSLVWRALGDLGWNSITAAGGSRRRSRPARSFG